MNFRERGITVGDLLIILIIILSTTFIIKKYNHNKKSTLINVKPELVLMRSF